MDRGKVKLGWVVARKARQVTLQKHRANLFKKASEISKLCDGPVAVVMYEPGKAEPTTWPPAPGEVVEVFQRYANMPDSATDELNLEGFHRQRIEKLRREVDLMKLTNRARGVFLVLDDLFAGRYHILEDLADDLAADVMAVVQLRKKVVSDRIKSLTTPLQEPSMVPTPAMANPPVLLPAAEPPAAAVAGMGVSGPVDMEGGELHRGSYLLQKVAAIMADESGSGVQPTDADVERFLRELLLF